MKPEFLNIPLTKNTEKKRFELSINNLVAFIEYDEDNEGQYSLLHTEAEAALAGTGAAAALVEKTFLYIDENKKEMCPFCPYIFSFLKKHPEWKKIVSKKFSAYNQL